MAILIVAVVLLAQAIVFLATVMSFRNSWLHDRALGARMVALAMSAHETDIASDHTKDLESRLLRGMLGAEAIGVRGQGTRWLLANDAVEPPPVDREIDLRDYPMRRLFVGTLRSLFSEQPGRTRLIAPGVPDVPGVEYVEVVLDETPLRRAVVAFAKLFLPISLAVSGLLGLLLYLGTHYILVAPVRRLTRNIESFAEEPLVAERIIVPSDRQDEIGRAEFVLSRMETVLARELREKKRLADLGLAVSKINHELRNMLTTAQLLTDRLNEVRDPVVSRVAPRLVKTLDRAIAFCQGTLAYGRSQEALPLRRRLPLRPLVEDQVCLAGLAPDLPIAFRIDLPEDLVVDADPDQLSRVLMNLIRNAVEALTRARATDGVIEVSAKRAGERTEIMIADNGLGVPERARDKLFTAFRGSEREGGIGLGLPVSEEIVRLHGGTITLVEGASGLGPAGQGARFRVTIPDRSGGGR